LRTKKVNILLILLIFSVSSLHAQKMGIQSVGINSGIFIPQKDWNNGFFLEFHTNFGEVLDYIFFTPYFVYLHSNRPENSYNLSLQYASFGSKILGYINPKPRGFYTGIDLSFNTILTESITSQIDENDPEIKQFSDTKIGLGALVGYLFKFDVFSINIETKYILMQGGFNTFQIGAGVNYYLK